MIAIINGPNLNRLGRRDTTLYGESSFEEFLEHLRSEFHETEIHYFQSNHEGAIIDEIQRLSDLPECRGLIINPGALAHYSYALADALRDASPFMLTMEVHISNILAREEFRRRSVTAETVNSGVISGCGLDGYSLALSRLINAQRNTQSKDSPHD